MSKEIGSCRAIINKVQNTADGGARVTLDIIQEDCAIATELLKRKLAGGTQELVFAAFVEFDEDL